MPVFEQGSSIEVGEWFLKSAYGASFHYPNIPSNEGVVKAQLDNSAAV
jgi:hypothetical protein